MASGSFPPLQPSFLSLCSIYIGLVPPFISFLAPQGFPPTVPSSCNASLPIFLLSFQDPSPHVLPPERVLPLPSYLPFHPLSLHPLPVDIFHHSYHKKKLFVYLFTIYCLSPPLEGKFTRANIFFSVSFTVVPPSPHSIHRTVPGP